MGGGDAHASSNRPRGSRLVHRPTGHRPDARPPVVPVSRPLHPPDHVLRTDAAGRIRSLHDARRRNSLRFDDPSHAPARGITVELKPKDKQKPTRFFLRLFLLHRTPPPRTYL